MTDLVNESIIDMLNDGIIRMGRLNNLIYIKNFIDRISSKRFIEEKTVRELESKYGVRPNIITWGDYFQTQMATSLHSLPDEEFDRAVETLKFDMIASWTIFAEKDRAFFDWVDLTYMGITNCNSTDLSEEEKEIVHLKILMDYYINLEIINNFTEAEMKWFNGFVEAKAQ